MKIKLDPGAKMPTRAHETDAGLDLYCREGAYILPHDHITFDTGIHIQLPPNTYGKIESKSGLNVNHNIVSCGGVIDEGYTGSIAVKLYNMGDELYKFEAGDKIAQLVIMPYIAPPMVQVDTLDPSDRGGNGFGSTGK